jgi:AcrR family transcriptional regulator
VTTVEPVKDDGPRPPQHERSKLTLRERKKARTRDAIQRHALRLFRDQGYEATPVSQIAEAAEVSESTFFRYFPTKEDVIMWDRYDPLILDAVRAQPAGSSPIVALRGAFRDVLGQLPAAEREQLRERIALVLSIPPLRALSANQLIEPLRLLAEALAERADRRPDDFAVRTLVGAVVGVCLSAALSVLEDPAADVVVLLDQAMAQLEAGLPV